MTAEQNEALPLAAAYKSEFAFVPEAVEACWRGSYGGDDEAEVREDLETLAATVDYCFNPRDDDAACTSILVNAILGAAEYIASIPCTCPQPEPDDDPCGRCIALGRVGDERVGR